MKASERFELAWSDYQALLLDNDVFIPLSQYCREHSLSYSYMGNWLSENGLSCYELRTRFKKCRKSKSSSLPLSENPSCSTPSANFISIPASCLPGGSSPWQAAGCVIKGVSLTFPDGVQVSIREIYQSDLNHFINEYNHKVEEEQPCLR